MAYRAIVYDLFSGVPNYRLFVKNETTHCVVKRIAVRGCPKDTIVVGNIQQVESGCCLRL